MDVSFKCIIFSLSFDLLPSRSVIDTLLDTMPATFANNTCIESATGPALQVGHCNKKSKKTRANLCPSSFKNVVSRYNESICSFSA